jgi:tricarballylate dehydrogenase
LDIIPWLTKQGLEWEVTDKEDHYPDEPMVKGRGPAMIDHLIHAAELKGVLIQYDIALEGLLTDEKGGVVGAKLVTKSGISKIECGAVILASGGFQASSEMRAKYLGAEEATMLVRGTSYDTGEGITIAMAAGAQAVGDWGGYHGTMAHISSPLSGGGIIMVPNYSHGILVNKMGKRIVDEASDYMYNTYAMLGRIVLRQPQGRVFFIFDAETVKHSGHRAGRVLEPVQAPTIRELAVKAGIDPEGLVRTVEEFNAAVQQGPYDPYELDGKHTSGIEPPKSNWAMPIDKPPFYSHEHVTGITFTYGGIKVNEKSEVLDSLNNPIPGLYAAGDIVGDYFYYNYGGGTGTTRCAVQGRIAGKNAAAFTGKG